ncbi:MAG: 5'-3' exonuclease H3TH domain-containing protein, partial [Pseudomonadota bacterium]
MSQKTPLNTDSRLYLVDGSAYIFRAFHALPGLTRKSDGLPVGAISGFCNMLWKLLTDVNDAAQEHIGTPTHFAVIFDHSSKTFRNDIYPAYKANRGEPPEDLVPQFPLIREATRAFGLPCIEQEGYEADDIMATHARLAEEAGAEVVIVSSDKDLTQLITDQTVMFDPMKNKIIDQGAVVEKFGVAPEKMIDLQALMGDSTDNIPGVPSIGPKTAAQLLKEYETLDALLERTGEIKQKKRREVLEMHKEEALLSRQLVTLERHVPVPDRPQDFGVTDLDHSQLVTFLEEMEFSTLTRRVREAGGVEAPPAKAPAAAPINQNAYETVFDIDQLKDILNDAEDIGVLAIDTETNSLNAMQARLVGVCLSARAGQGVYVPLTHGSKGGAEGLDLDDEDAARQLSAEDVVACLRPILANPAILKIGQNLKYDALVLARYGLEIISYDDTMLMSYAADCGLRGHGMDELSQLHLGHKPIAFSSVVGTGKKAKTFDQIPIKDASPYAAEDADITFRLHQTLRQHLLQQKMSTVYETLDRPLVPVIVQMERHGIKVDQKVLADLSHDFSARMANHEKAAHDAAGEAFNLGSPKQIGEILFGKLGLPG